MKTWQKTVSFITSFSLLLNSVAAPLSVLAQETTPEPTPIETQSSEPVVTQTPEATPEVTPSPSEVTPTPVAEVTSIPEATIEPVETPAEAIPQSNNESNPTTQGPPSNENNQTPSSSTAPVVTVQQPQNEGQITATVIEDVDLSEVLDPGTLVYGAEGTPTVVTDKADYAPTDVVLITGTSFDQNETYTLIITSNDQPPVNFQTPVLIDEVGSFSFAYQLDGNYRPNYQIKVLNGSQLLAQTTFTDSDTGFKSPSAEGGNENDWLNGDRAYSSNDSYTTETSESDDQSYENFAFSVPAGATINGIEVKIEAKSSDTAGCAIQPRIWSESDNDNSDRKSLEINGVDTVYTFGASNDLWGNTWIPSDFTDANFYAEFQYDDFSGNNCSDSGTTVSVDHIQVKVHYTEATPTPTPTATPTPTPTATPVPTLIPAVVNPVLPQACGLDIALVLDVSGSIDSGELSQMKTAMTGLVSALAGTPTEFSVTKFDTTASVVQAFSGNTATVNTAINGVSGGGFTNWEDGFIKGNSTLPNRTNPNLVIFASDGQPNTIGNGPANNASPDGSITAMNPAITIANTIKTGGSRILGIGIGLDASGTANMKLVSGPNADTGSFITSDLITTNFATLATQLATFASQTCGGTISIHKVVTGEQNPTLSGWHFTVNGQDYVTDAQGNTQAIPVPPGTYSAVEVTQPAYTLTNKVCTINNSPAGSPIANGVGSLTVGANDIVSCTFTNDKNPVTGSVKVNKLLDSEGNGSFETTNPASYLWGLDAGTVNKVMGTTTSSVSVGAHTVTENSVAGSHFVGWYPGGTGSTQYSCTNLPQGNNTLPANITVVSAQTTEITLCNTADTATIELKKAWTGTAGQTTLNIGTSNAGSQVGTQLTGAAGAAPLTTGQNTVVTGTYYVSETGGLTNYSSALACYNDVNNNGANNGEPTVTVGANNSVAVTTGQHVICTFTNTRNQGKIELQKDFVGTPENVTIKIGTAQNGSQVDSDVLSADGTDGEHTVDTGTYFVSEILTTPSNYTAGLACYNDVNHNNAVDGGDTSHTVNTGTGEVLVSTSDDVICVFTNTRNTGSVKVNKLADTDGNGTYDSTNPAPFNWSLDGSGTNAMGSTVAGVNTGTHSVNENSVADYHLVGWYPGGTGSTQYTCNNLPVGDAFHTLPAGFSVANDALTEITICNAINTGTVVVHKDVFNPDGGVVTDTTTNFAVLIDSGNSQNVTDGGTVTYNNVVVGNHTITESPVPSAYTLYGISLVAGTSGNTGGLQVSVANGQTTHVYVTNKQKKAIITVVKDVRLSNGSDTSDAHGFSVTLNGETKPFAEGTNAEFSVNPGEYGAVEGVDTNYTLVTNDGPKTVVSNGSATITIVNWQNPAQISGYKFNADGQTPISGWGINLLNCAAGFVNCVQGATTTTNGSGFYSFTGLISGYYQVAEIMQNGWTNLTNLFINVTTNPGSNSTGNNFSNFQNISISGQKFEDLDGDGVKDPGEPGLANWTIKLNGDQATTSTTGDGSYLFTNLGPGNYTITEVQQDGWTQSTTNPSVINAVSGQNVTNIDFGNYQKAHITVIKQVVRPDGTTDVNDPSTGFVFGLTGHDNFTLYDEDGGEEFEVNPGTYTVFEIPDSNYLFVDCIADYEYGGEEISVLNGETVKVGSGDEVAVTCVNAQNPVTINGYKWSDLNGNSLWDFIEGEGDNYEPTLSGWTITLERIVGEGSIGMGSDETDENGFYEFTDLNPGTYRVCEIQQGGWDQTFPINENGNCHLLVLGSNAVSENNNFGNWERILGINIVKSNDKSGSVNPGGSVNYTLVVTNTGNRSLNNIEVTDALPGGFTYVPGSTQLNSSAYSDPSVLGSQLKWNIGSLSAEESVELTYQVVISSELHSGTYKNLATCTATFGSQGPILLRELIALDLPFEGGETVECNVADSSVTVSTDPSFGGNLNPQVLGISTVLPATGSATWMLIIALVTLGSGFILKGLEKQKGKKHAKN